MISFEEAVETVLKNAAPLPARLTRIEDAVGMALLEDVRSGVDMPPFDKSAMDGYAVRAADLVKGRRLRQAGVVQAGAAFRRSLRPGECVKIMTGAPVPRGADAVVMVEETSERDGIVEFGGAVRRGDNIARRGEDMRRGELILRRGAVIAVQHIGALAAAGRARVRTGSLPRVALINTGGEIVPPGAKLGGNSIYNSNGPMLSALLRTDGVAAAPLIVPDDGAKLRAALAAALKADIALISGGVSMGDYDLVPAVLKALGVRRLFHTVRVRPGKPMFFGRKGRTLVFGIPGNPVANFMAYMAYIRPVIRKMAGRPDFAPDLRTGVCAGAFRPRTPRRAMVLSTVRAGVRYSLSAVSNNGSADIKALAEAGAFTMVREGGGLRKKEKARFLAWA